MVLARKEFLGIIALALTGCGGGTGVASLSNTTQSGSAGMSSFTFTGRMKPLVSAGTGQVTVSGLSGASFSTIFLQPTKSLANTYIAFSRQLSGPNPNYSQAVYKSAYPTGAVTAIASSVYGCNQPTTSASGYIAFSRLNGEESYRMKADGSQVSSLTTGEFGFIDPAYSPDGTKIAFYVGGLELDYCPSAGGSSTLVQSNDYGLGVAWTSDGSHLIYAAANGSYYSLYSTALGGGATSDVSPGMIDGSGSFTFPTCSSDGVTMACQYQPGGSGNTEIVEFTEFSNLYHLLTPSGYSDSYPSFSPDGTAIAFYRSNAGGASPGIYISDTAGDNQYLLVPDPTGPGLTGPVTGLSWSPFPANTKFVGTGSGFFTSTANGFLLSQNLNQFGSMVVFTVTTPSSATITASTPTSTYQPLIFTLAGDSINKVAWTNNFYNGGSTQTPPTGTTNALVTIDAQTGQVDLVADAVSFKPATNTRTAGGTATYQGKFTAIYDGTGKNLAPNGANQVVVNQRTGRLVSLG